MIPECDADLYAPVQVRKQIHAATHRHWEDHALQPALKLRPAIVVIEAGHRPDHESNGASVV